MAVPAAVRAVAVAHDAELGGDDHSIAPALERLADEALVAVRSIHISGVEKRDAEIEPPLYERNSLRLGRAARGVKIRKSHTAETELGHLEPLPAQSSLSHDGLLKKMPESRFAP